MAQKKSILITGGTGFAGSHLVEFLLSKKINKSQIHVTSFSNKKNYLHKFLNKNNIHVVDLTNSKQTNNLFKKNNFLQIYHLASLAAVQGSFANKIKIINNNINLQKNLLSAIDQYCPEAKILHISSAAVYATSEQKLSEKSKIKPDSPYAESKLEQEKINKNYLSRAKSRDKNLKIITARPFNHIGERQSPDFAISAFAKQIAELEKNGNNKILVGNLDAVRDFTDVKDMVKAYYLLMQKGKTANIYNIGSGVGYQMADILDRLVKLSKTKIEVELDQNKLRPSDKPYLVCNNNKIKRLGWKPKINIDQSLVRILNYWRNKI